MANVKDHVKRLREETGAGVMDCKRALDEAKGDFEKAKALIKERGLARAKEKSDREAKEGVVEAYVHAGGRIGDSRCLEDDRRARHGRRRQDRRERPRKEVQAVRAGPVQRRTHLDCPRWPKRRRPSTAGWC